MKRETRGASPDDDISVKDGHTLRALGPLESAEEKLRRKAERHRNDRSREIALVAVLMKGERSAGLIAVDEARIGFEIRITGFVRG